MKARLRLAGQASDNKVQGCEQRQADRPDNQSANERERESWLPGEREREEETTATRAGPGGQGSHSGRERERERPPETKGSERDPWRASTRGERGDAVSQAVTMLVPSFCDRNSPWDRERNLSIHADRVQRSRETSLSTQRESRETERVSVRQRESKGERENSPAVSRHDS